MAAKPSVQEMALAELELRRRARERLTMPPEVIIPGDMSFTDWCIQLGKDGLKVDGIPFSLEDRPAMRFVYDLIPKDMGAAYRQTLVLQKCAQVGFTVLEMLAAIYFALKWQPCKIGMYLPDMKLAGVKSSVRFMPILRTVPVAYRRLLGDGGKSGEGNVLTRSMGDSHLHFMWTSGKAMTESIPLDVLSFDEVQEMTIESMEKTRERLSASRIRFTIMGSTANWPDADINFWYKKGNQYRFFTLCPVCGEYHILDDYFPECIRYNDLDAGGIPLVAGAPLQEYVYVCKSCGGWIDDPQRGEWRATATASDVNIISVHYPQFLSPTISAREIIEAYQHAQDIKNFYNRKLGKPYTDPSQVPINLEVLNNCATEGKRAGLVWKTSGKQTFMGVDNMGGFSCVLVSERLPDGRMAFIHAEAVYGINPWARLDELMENFRVAVCVCEQLPNYDSAKQFAQRWQGRVFLVSSYKNIDDDMLQWGDAVLSKADRKTDENARDRYTLALDQYKMMSWAFGRIIRKQPTTIFPDPAGLVQDIDEKGVVRKMPILRDVVWHHFMKTALVTEKDDDEHKMRRKVVKIGIDPHFSFAYMLMCAAWCRAYGTSTFILPTMNDDKSTLAQSAEDAGLSPQVSGLIHNYREGTCGKCANFDAGHCTERGFLVKPEDPGCPLYIPVDG